MRKRLMEIGFDILYDDGPCLVVNKPPGLLTQSPPGVDSLENRIKAFLARQEKKSNNDYLGVPHRLDRPSSGAMVFGRTQRATRHISEQFEKRQVEKLYWACVEGQIEPAEGIWEDDIRKIPAKAMALVAPPDHPDARGAILHYRTLQNFDWGTWLEIRLETGRTHQIRVQSASRGHPVLGDTMYGATTSFGPSYDDTRLRAIALHARKLTFRHPITRETVSCIAPLTKTWLKKGIEDD